MTTGDFQIDSQGGQLFLPFPFLDLLGRLATQHQRERDHRQQIEIETHWATYHSDDTKSEHDYKVKTDMGQQSNKTTKRKRRLAYLKRRKAAVKAKRKSAAK